MSKRHKRPGTTASSKGKGSPGIWLLVCGVLLAAAAALWWTSQPPKPAAAAAKGNPSTSNVVSLAVTISNLLATGADTNIPTMEAAQSVMVTQPLDFGNRVPTPAEALMEVERLSKADDGTGRTFSILEAFGFTNETGKLQLSMRISSEKPGLAALVFKRTGEVLWKTRVVSRPGPPPGTKTLMVMLEEDDGKQLVVDGSKNPSSILEAGIHQSDLPMKSHWPDGTEKTIVFIYSACGCPVKVKVRRVGDKTMRTSDWPVLFPDDADAMRVINSLMGWPSDGVMR